MGDNDGDVFTPAEFDLGTTGNDLLRDGGIGSDIVCLVLLLLLPLGIVGGAIDGCCLGGGCFDRLFFMLLLLAPEYGTFPFKGVVAEFFFLIGNDCVRCGDWGGSNFLGARAAGGGGCAILCTGNDTVLCGEGDADDDIRRFSISLLGVKGTGLGLKFPDGAIPAGRGIDATRCGATLFIGGGGGCCRCCKLPGLPADRGMDATRCGGTGEGGGPPEIPTGRSND
jgi:hypothetical protein